MKKKIVVLNGSPRKKGNTSMLIDAFVRGAESAGHSVTRFDLYAMAVKPCIGCLGGGKDKASPCVQKDAMEQVYPAYREADILVLASPLYYFSFSAQLKAAIDRLFAVTEADGADAPKKSCVMLVAAADNSAEGLQPMVDYYRSFVSHLGWTDAGMVLAGGVMNVGDIVGKPSLAEAEALGASLK